MLRGLILIEPLHRVFSDTQERKSVPSPEGLRTVFQPWLVGISAEKTWLRSPQHDFWVTSAGCALAHIL